MILKTKFWDVYTNKSNEKLDDVVDDVWDRLRWGGVRSIFFLLLNLSSLVKSYLFQRAFCDPIELTNNNKKKRKKATKATYFFLSFFLSFFPLSNPQTQKLLKRKKKSSNQPTTNKKQHRCLFHVCFLLERVCVELERTNKQQKEV